MALLTQKAGALGTQSGTGTSPNQINVDGWNLAALYIQITTGGSTIQIEQSIDGGTTWNLIFAVNMGTGVIGTTSGTANALWRVDNPAGLYRTNIPTTFVAAANAFYRFARNHFGE